MEAALGSRVGGMERQGVEPQNRPDEHDRRIAAVGQMRQGFPDEFSRGDEIQIEDAIKQPRIDIAEATDAASPGRCDHQIEPAEPRYGDLDEMPAEAGIADVTRLVQHRLVLISRRGQLSETFLAAGRCHDPAAPSGEFQSHGSSYP